jgi:MFS family permease
MFEHMLRAFRHKNYRLYFIGQGISLTGNWLSDVAMAWMVYRLTRDIHSGNSALYLGIVGFAEQIPMLLLSPIAGVFVDRWNRRTILIVTNILSMLQSVGLAILAFTHIITIPHLLMLSVFQGVVNSFDMPARQAFLVEIVENRDDLPNAIALNSSMFNGARLVGPAVAGLLIAAVGEAWCFTVDAISYLAVLGCLLAMVIHYVAPSQSKRQSAVNEFKDGLAYTFGQPPILTTLLFVGCISFMVMPMMVLMPIFADQISGTAHGARTLGFLMAATGIGALFGGVYLASRKSVVGIGKVMVGAAILLGATMIGFTAGTSFGWRMANLFAGGFGMILVMASGNTFLQSVVPDKKRGRVMSLFGTAIMGMAPFGSLLSGWLATRIGEATTMDIAGGCCVAAGVIFGAMLPRLRKYVHPMYLEKGIMVAPVVPPVGKSE